MSPCVARELGLEQLEGDDARRSARARRGRPGPCRPRRGAPRCGMARRRRPPQPPVEDNRAGLDRRSGTLDSRVVRRSRKPWIGVLVAICTMAADPESRGRSPTRGRRRCRRRSRARPSTRRSGPARCASGCPARPPSSSSPRPQQLPIGTTFDTTARARDADLGERHQGATQHAWFYEGTFTIGQTTGSKPITTLALAGALPACPKASRGAAGAAAKRKSAPPVGRRQGPLPHLRAVQLGHGARHPLGRLRPLRRDAHARRARERSRSATACATRP